MPPGLWRWLIMVAIDVVYLAWSVIRVSLNGVSAWQMLVVAGWSAFLAFDWPRFKREWDAWRRDDD